MDLFTLNKSKAAANVDSDDILEKSSPEKFVNDDGKRKSTSELKLSKKLCKRSKAEFEGSINREIYDVKCKVESLGENNSEFMEQNKFEKFSGASKGAPKQRKNVLPSGSGHKATVDKGVEVPKVKRKYVKKAMKMKADCSVSSPNADNVSKKDGCCSSTGIKETDARNYEQILSEIGLLSARSKINKSVVHIESNVKGERDTNMCCGKFVPKLPLPCTQKQEAIPVENKKTSNSYDNLKKTDASSR